MAPIIRDGFEYEFDVVGDMDIEHNLVVTKSRCKALADRTFHKPGKDFVDVLLTWISTKPVEPTDMNEEPKHPLTDSEVYENLKNTVHSGEAALKMTKPHRDNSRKKWLGEEYLENLHECPAEKLEAYVDHLRDKWKEEKAKQKEGAAA